MENFQKGFVSFIASFISSQSDNPKTRETLVRRMMRMKDVQKIIIDSMSQLSSIIYKELLSIENIKSISSFKITPKNSKLIVLAEEVKKIMNNYIFIQSKVSDMREIIEKFDDHLDASNNSNEYNKLFSYAYQFLSSIPQNPVISNSEIEEISAEIWSKQLEVETMLKIEVEKLRQFQNSVESRYFNKLSSVKTKAGLKIQKLENEISALELSNRERLNRCQMRCEDLLSLDFEKSNIELARINKIFDPSSIKDLPEAFSKIKELLRIKNIYEKKRNKDEILLKALNSKLQVLLPSYEELSAKHIGLEARFEELKKNHESLVESTLKTREKAKIITKDSFKIEQQARTEIIFSDFPIKNESIIDPKIYSRPRNESIRISKLDKRKLSPKKKMRTATPSTRPNLLKELQEKQGHNIEEFRQALIVIDERFKETNKALIENLEELVDYKIESEISEESKEVKNLMQPRRSLVITPDKEFAIPSQNNLFKIEEEVKLEDKETQVLYLSNTQYTQTVPDLLKKIEETLKSHKRRDKVSRISDTESFVLKLIVDSLKDSRDKTCQTEKEESSPVDVRLSYDNELIRGLLTRKHRSTLVPSKEKEWNIANIIKKIIKIPVVTQNLEEIRGTHITELLQATDEYKKEFLIQSQLRGFKRLELDNVQELWEEIIQRRISQGEQDKISVYLRGLLGTETFEREKKSVIDMIETSKMSDFRELITKPEKIAKKKINSLKNWKKIMMLLLSKNIEQFIELAAAANPIDLLFEAAIKVKFIKDRLRKNRKIQVDGFGFTKSDKWVLRSITPILVAATRVKSRYLQPRRNMTAERVNRTRMLEYRNI